MAMNQKTAWIFLLVLVVLGFTVRLRRTKPHVGTSKPPASELKPLSYAIPPQGLKRKIAIRLRVSKTCDLGDLDAINIALQRSGSPKDILISLEELSAKPRIASQVRALSESELLDGANIDFPLTVTQETIPMGIFICKDSERAGRCYAKEAIHASDVIVKDTLAAREGQFQSPDRIYMFQYLELQEKEIRWLPEFAWSETLSDAHVPAYAIATTQALEPAEFNLSGEVFLLSLSKHDPTGCR